MRVAVVGCGLIGRRRAKVVQRSPDDELVIVADVDEGRARSLAREMGCLTTTDWQEAVARDDVDVIIAATPNKYLMPITVAALDSGKHVLCEKPPGRNPTEARQMVDAAQRSGRVLKIGFNFAPGSTRPTNRATPISEPHPPSATCGEPGRTVSHQLEDNAFVLLRTADGCVAQWHTSWTQWKNRFTFEVFGRDGYVRVDGLGGSYGIETLTVGYRRPESGPPEEERFEFTRPDPSWQAEWQEFASAIREGRQPLASGEEGLEAMRLIAAIYESALYALRFKFRGKNRQHFRQHNTVLEQLMNVV